MLKILDLLNGIKNNKYTTIIGAVAIAYGVWYIWDESGDTKWGIGLILIGAGLLFAKDGDKDKNEEIENKLDSKYGYEQPRNMEFRYEEPDDYDGYPRDYPYNDREFEQFYNDNHRKNKKF